MGRQSHELKDEIQDCLDRRPMTATQLRKKIGTNQNTVKKHLQELEDLCVVRSFTKEVDETERTLWETM